MYKYIITNEEDKIMFGKNLITKIKNKLYDFQINIKLADGQLLDYTNLFDFLEFRIVGEYIEIINVYTEKNSQKITKDLVKSLSILSEAYDKIINYEEISTIIFENQSIVDITKNQLKIDECLNIMSQEFIIAFQPDIEILIWNIIRLIICWYSDNYLFENILKIKLLINLYRSRGNIQYNIDNNVLPLIQINMNYGKKVAEKISIKLDGYFLLYSRLANLGNKPSYFRIINPLMYFTNGSLMYKKYLKLLKKIENYEIPHIPQQTLFY